MLILFLNLLLEKKNTVPSHCFYYDFLPQEYKISKFVCLLITICKRKGGEEVVEIQKTDFLYDLHNMCYLIWIKLCYLGIHEGRVKIQQEQLPFRGRPQVYPIFSRRRP